MTLSEDIVNDVDESVALGSKAILSSNLITFVQAILDATEAGWEIDPKNPPTTAGWGYECQMLRDLTVVDEYKPTVDERLAKARQAKAAKRLAAESQE